MADTKYLEVADGLGSRLCRDAIWSGGRCNWLGDSMEFIESRWQVAHRAFGPEMYNGTSGIALFLGHLFSCTQEKLFRKTAEGAIECALSQLNRLNPVVSFGFYSGLTGIAYALTELGELLSQERFTQLGLQLLEETLGFEPAAEQSWDIVSGSAGMIPVLLKLHGRYKQPCLFEAAVKHGERVLNAAQPSEDGWSWKTIPDQSRNLTGFSHGTAGIAWALLELYQQSKEERFLGGAQEAFRYERRWFDPQQENWPDFRSQDPTGGPVCAAAWCHGAPGIGLSRLRCHQILQDEKCLLEAQAAIRATAKILNMSILSGQGNLCLCHGNCGNAELLIAAADQLGDANSRQLVQQLAADALEKHHAGRNPWPCGVLNGGETPNLMLGLAGIGHFFLRLHDRDKAPSLLLVGPE